MKRLATRFFAGSLLVRLCVACVLTLATASAGSAAQYNLIHAFTGAPNDGANPQYGALITDGTSLYGMTQNGGADNVGTVFKVNPDGSGYQLLHSFAGMTASNPNGNPNDGAIPYGSLLLIGSTLYGTSAYGGVYTIVPGVSLGCVFKINTDGSGFSLIHSFDDGTAPNDGYSPQGSLVTDGTNLFGMNFFCTTLAGNVFAISTNGSNFKELHDFTGSGYNGYQDGSGPYGSLVYSAGALYGMTSEGGSNSQHGTIFRINSDGTGYQIIHTFTGLDGSEPRGSLIISNSTLYGMTSGRSGDFGSVFSVGTDGSNFQVLHSFSTFSGNDLQLPFGDLTLSNSTLYGMASTNGSGSGSGGIFQINTDGTGYQIIHDFTFGSPNNLQDGSTPEGSLLLFNSQLYGMTEFGGSTNNDGAIFSFGTFLGSSLEVTILPAAVVNAGAQWQVDGGSFLNSGVTVTNLSYGPHTISFTPVAGWKTAPEQIAIVSPGTTNMVTATYTDPTVAISTPTPKQFISNSVFMATGTASDDVAIAGVCYQLNGGAWSAASTANNWTNWSVTNLVFAAGTNVLSVYAMDTSSNLSATNTVSFVYVPSAQLAVSINGPGTVTPNLDGDFVALGKTVSMTAKAGKGCAFVNWTGSTNSTRTKLTFIMTSNLQFTANFKDTSRPVNAILSPTKNHVVTDLEPVATGKAKDNVGVASVWFALNGGSWTAANLADGTNWTTPPLTLLSGFDSISAFAEDAAGNNSLTNTVVFKYVVEPVADWAPDSLNGLIASLMPEVGAEESISFDLSSYADSIGDDYGSYSYIKTDTNMAQLSLSLNPPLTLVFTGYYAGYFTNTHNNTIVGFNMAIATSFIPATVIGKSITTTSSQNAQISTIKLATSTFAKKTSNNSNSGTSSGNYTFARYSPVAGVFTFVFTDAADAGTTDYMQLTFTNATTGTYYVTIFDDTDTLEGVDSGQFTLK